MIGAGLEELNSHERGFVIEPFEFFEEGGRELESVIVTRLCEMEGDESRFACRTIAGGTCVSFASTR